MNVRAETNFMFVGEKSSDWTDFLHTVYVK